MALGVLDCRNRTSNLGRPLRVRPAVPALQPRREDGRLWGQARASLAILALHLHLRPCIMLSLGLCVLACLSICPSVWLSVAVSVCLFLCPLSFCWFVHRSSCLCMYVSLCLAVRLLVRPPWSLPVWAHACICMCICMCTHALTHACVEHIIIYVARPFGRRRV